LLAVAVLFCVISASAAGGAILLLPDDAARSSHWTTQPAELGAPLAPEPWAHPAPNTAYTTIPAPPWAISDDALAGRVPMINTMPAPSLTFEGLGAAGVAPPGISLAVGRDRVMQVVENARLRVFDKFGAPQGNTLPVHTVFAGLAQGGICRTQVNDGAASARYDSLADRWIVMQAVVATSPRTLCIAVSVGADPLGEYHAYAYPLPTTTPFYFYPRLGVWRDAYYVSLARYDSTFVSVIGTAAIAIDRLAVLRGDVQARAIYVDHAITRGFHPPAYRHALPADLFGLRAPPPDLPALFAQPLADELGASADMVRLFAYTPRFDDPPASTYTLLGDVALAAFDGRSPAGRAHIEQAEGELLDSQTLDLQPSFAYRNLGSDTVADHRWVGNFTVNVSAQEPIDAASYQAGVRWFEMQGDALGMPALRDQGTHVPSPAQGATGTNTWVGSIALDNAGQIALGYSQASATERATPMIAARGAAPAAMLDYGVAEFHAPGGVQTQTFNRWGDYSAMSIDPVDGCTFWHANEYYAQNASFAWRTRIGRFMLPQCVASPQGELRVTVTQCADGTPIANAQVDAGDGAYARQTDAQGLAIFVASPGSYSIRARAPTNQFGTLAGPVSVTANATTSADLCVNVPPDALFVDGLE
jgi:hypothetical protein